MSTCSKILNFRSNPNFSGATLNHLRVRERLAENPLSGDELFELGKALTSEIHVPFLVVDLSIPGFRSPLSRFLRDKGDRYELSNRDLHNLQLL